MRNAAECMWKRKSILIIWDAIWGAAPDDTAWIYMDSATVKGGCARGAAGEEVQHKRCGRGGREDNEEGGTDKQCQIRKLPSEVRG